MPLLRLVNTPPDDRSNMAKAYQWLSRIFTVALEMVVPGLVGYWLDQRLGTRVVFTLLGFAFGVPWAIWHLLRMTSAAEGDSADEPRKPRR